MTHVLYLMRHGQAELYDGPLNQALDAPPWRWRGVNQMNCAVSITGFLPGSPRRADQL